MRILVLLLFLPSLAFAEVAGPTVVTEWNVPATLTDVSGYRIYCSTIKGGPYTRVGEVLGATTKTATVTNCKPLGTTGSAYFVSTSFSVDGRESAYSNEAVRTWIAANPEAPTMAACVPQIVKMKVATRTGYTDRPLYADAARNKIIGRVEIGQPCEDATLQTTSSGEWRWTTNLAGLRGVSLCK